MDAEAGVGVKDVSTEGTGTLAWKVAMGRAG